MSKTKSKKEVVHEELPVVLGDFAPVPPTPEELRVKILHLLTIYPIISPTMLQGGLGPAKKPALWRPVLEQLKAEGLVVETQESMLTPTDRYNTYTKLSLPGTVVTFEPAVQ